MNVKKNLIQTAISMKKNVIRRYHSRWNVQDLDDQYLKGIKLDVLTFNGRLDPQLFLLQHMNKYFAWYPLSEARKAKFATMKLTGQVSQYLTNM